MSKKPTVLMILDGYGLNDKQEANAVYEAKTPVMDKLMEQAPFVKGYASGLAVGLPDGQMGNSEVGHLNMGAGRIVYQELTRITKEIEDGVFFENEALLKAVGNAKANDSALHMFGLVSDGGVHSHNTHIYGLLELAKRHGLKKVYVHCFLDGHYYISLIRLLELYFLIHHYPELLHLMAKLLPYMVLVPIHFLI